MKQVDLSCASLKSILDIFPDIKYIELQGEGEPLLNHEFINMASFIRSRNILVSTITNGSLLSDFADQIIDADIHSINVSIDSTDQQKFREIRGGDIERIIGGIKKLLSIREKRKAKHPYISFNVTLNRETLDDVQGIIDLYNNLGADGGIYFQPLQSMEAYTRYYSPKLLENIPDDDDLKYIHEKFYSMIKLINSGLDPDKSRRFYTDMRRNWDMESSLCPWLDRGLYITAEGNALPCCFVKDTSQYSFGIVGIDPINEIIRRRKDMKESFTHESIPECCFGCRY